MTSGVNIKIKENEPKRIPNPIITMNKPSNIGFLICAYKPVVINFGGGLKETKGRERTIFRRVMENYYVIIWNKSREGGRDGK